MSEHDLEVTVVPVGDLISDPENARLHNERNLEAIRNSLRSFGQRRPILVSAENVVVAGNGTLEAARSMGWKQIAISRLPEDWTPDQVRAYALADNRTAELAAWDEGVLGEQLLELSSAEWDIAALGFGDLSKETKSDSPDEFPSVDDSIPIEFCCPSCGYEWSGAPR